MPIMKTVSHIAACFSLILILSFNAAADDIIRIGTYDYKPFVFINNDGAYSGIYIDIIDYIADAEDWRVDYVDGTWAQGLQRLKRNEIDLLIAISYTEQRGQIYDFNKEPLLTNRGQIYKQKSLAIESINDLRDKKIAMYKDDIFTIAFKKLVAGYNIKCEHVEVDNLKEVFQLINDKKVHAGVANNVSWMYNKVHYEIEETPIIFLPTELLFATAKGRHIRYLDTIDEYLVKIKADRSSVYYQSIDKWTIDKLDIISPKKRFPRWAVYLLISAGGVTLSFFFISLILKQQIKKKTTEITYKNLRLHKEISKRKQTTEELVLHEKKLTNLMDNLPGMVYRLSYDGQWAITSINSGSDLILGYDESYFRNEKPELFEDLIHPDDYQKVIRTIQEETLKKLPYSLMYRIKMKNGTYKWISDRGKLVSSDKNGLMECEGFISDITQQQESELQLRKENIQLRSSMRDRYKFGNIIGKCKAMQNVYELILKASASSESVSIYGETGTGKELVARAIHDLSDRSDKEFVVVNCSAIPENLIESEFFGHVKGAFTGAYKDKKGFLELADGGTLFLDEIGDISLNTQVKLLRAIEGSEYTTVGSTKKKKSDFRIVSASNKNLKQLVQQEALRQDFYYRIHVIPIEIPPLRERKEDIPLLADFFMEQHDEDFRLAITGNILEALLDYDWPGNVREFQNKINRFAVLKKIDLPNLKSHFMPSTENPIVNEMRLKDEDDNFQTLQNAIAIFEKQYLKLLLVENNWHRGRVSEILNINRKTLFRKIKSYDLKK
jgi:PAS domain S-box-containing protein